MNALNHWWNKYQILRKLKSEYLKRVKEGENSEMLKELYWVKIFDAIK